MKYTKTTEELDGYTRITESSDVTVVTRINVYNECGEKELKKPCGNYAIIAYAEYYHYFKEICEEMSCLVRNELKTFFKKIKLKHNAPVLVVGIGNPDNLIDSFGPKVCQKIIATKFMFDSKSSKELGFKRPVYRISPNVMGNSGVQTFDMVKTVVDKIIPRAIIAIDGFLTKEADTLFSAIHISDKGITPGHSDCNNKELSFETLNVPIITIGVPVLTDITEMFFNYIDSDKIKNQIKKQLDGITFTVSDVDQHMRSLIKVLGNGINMALQEWEIEDINKYM